MDYKWTTDVVVECLNRGLPADVVQGYCNYLRKCYKDAEEIRQNQPHPSHVWVTRWDNKDNYWDVRLCCSGDVRQPCTITRSARLVLLARKRVTRYTNYIQERYGL